MRDLSDMAEQPSEKEIENHYRRLFAAKFKTYCPITNEDKNIFYWLGSEFGKVKSIQILEQYFKSQDKFLIEKGYAPKFIKTSIVGIVSKLSDLKKEPNPKKKTIAMLIGCDTCFRDFTWTGDPKELDNPSYKRLCENCMPENY